MSKIEQRAELQAQWSEEKESLLKMLSAVFDAPTAMDFVSPKTSEAPREATIEDLLSVNLTEQKERIERLRLTDRYRTTTQSLSRADLEESYQAFVREQVGRRQNRQDLEQFVRNSSDIDVAKRYLDAVVDVRGKPLQSDLLFYSSKLNEEQAFLCSRTNDRTLRQINADLSLNKYFPFDLMAQQEKREHFHEKTFHFDQPKSIKIERGEKKYRINFARTSSALQSLIEKSRQTFNEKDRRLIEQKNLESFLSAETSTNAGQNSIVNTETIHREIFPALSISALKEYRPSITPTPSATIKSPSRSSKTFYKTDFIWEQSIVSPSHD